MAVKKFNKIMLVAALAASFSVADNARAQYQPVGDDGIAASPKLREQLNERKHVANAPSTTVASAGYQATGDDGITASPKLRQMLDERKSVASTPSSAVASVGYKPTGADGITASPKLRQQLDERNKEWPTYMVAPLKISKGVDGEEHLCKYSGRWLNTAALVQ